MNKILLSHILFALMSLTANAQTVSKYIVADQFGYLPDAIKIAIIRDPHIGFDASESFTPGAEYAVVNAEGTKVFTDAPQIWSAGSLDSSSGDKAWSFDFTAVKTAGEYFILDVNNNVRSYKFKIDGNVYNDILKQAVRTFFYQRAGIEKKATHAGEAWADGASHLQDKKARLYNDSTNVTKEKDVSGGWYDAGDYNKYSNWTSSYIIQMLLAYLEKPGVWTDDYNIPESGNKIPDLLDEAKWGIDHLLRMQEKNGSVVSIASLSHASPPSAAKGNTYYGAVNTSSTQSAATAFAFSSIVYRLIGMTAYADTLVNRAKLAWTWSAANPNVIWKNNDAAYKSEKIGAGQQEQGEYDRVVGRLKAAIFLYAATQDNSYKLYVESNYQKAHLLEWNYAYPFEGETQEVLLYYTSLPGISQTVKSAIINAYKTSMNSGDNFPAFTNWRDPYRAYLKDYTWGSNNIKSIQGNMFYNIINYAIDPAKNVEATNAAASYIHYIHGLNPLSFSYLSNMYGFGADNGVNEFYHTWFYDKSPKWDRVGTSLYGPAPGFLTGGANPSYDVDGCCATGCNGFGAVCTSENITPPKGQPKQKAYKDFNTSWPLNSWSVTENSNGYQISYIRLLSKFVNTNPISAVTDNEIDSKQITFYPNPSNSTFNILNLNVEEVQATILDLRGITMKKFFLTGNVKEINISDLPSGTYIVKLQFNGRVIIKSISKL